MAFTHSLPQFAFLAGLQELTHRALQPRADTRAGRALSPAEPLPDPHRPWSRRLAHPAEADQVRLDLARTMTRMRSPFAGGGEIHFDASPAGAGRVVRRAQRRVDELKLLLRTAASSRCRPASAAPPMTVSAVGRCSVRLRCHFALEHRATGWVVAHLLSAQIAGLPPPDSPRSRRPRSAPPRKEQHREHQREAEYADGRQRSEELA